MNKNALSQVKNWIDQWKINSKYNQFSFESINNDILVEEVTKRITQKMEGPPFV